MNYRAKHFIPWTHRIYHIQDDTLFEMENPGEPFKALLTPSRKMDICDLSIYDNRWVYFGWGHSIVFTASAQGTATFRTDPADDLPLHETSHNFPELQRTIPEIGFGRTSIEIVESPDWVEIRLEATDLNGVPLTSPIVAGSDFLLRAFTEDRRRVDDPTFPILDMGQEPASLPIRQPADRANHFLTFCSSHILHHQKNRVYPFRDPVGCF